MFKFPCVVYDVKFERWFASEWREPTHNAKELFYTLENVGVNTEGLTTEQKKELESIFIDFKYIRVPFTKKYTVIAKSPINVSGSFNEITYEKFMELFASNKLKDKNMFKTREINYDLNDFIIIGKKPLITFKTGNLKGLSFYIEKSKYSKENNETEITLGSRVIDGLELPNDEFKPNENDLFDITDISIQYEVKYIAEQPKPEHYAKGIDTFARMEANCTTEECLAFAKGNIDKYNFRTKGQDLEDYKKIVSYANWAIKLLENAKNN